MTVWIKQGVMGRLSFHMQKAQGELVSLFEEHGEDFFITSVEEGNHSGGSFHYIGCALDFKRMGVPKKEIEIRLRLLAHRIGGRFDVVEYEDSRDIFHVEYDPL